MRRPLPVSPTPAQHEASSVFGPTAAAARIESSKTFAKQVMDAAGIPTARWIAGGAADRKQLSAFVGELGGRCVVKADGLALGKGVAVCGGIDEAERALDECLAELRFGDAGARSSSRNCSLAWR